MRTYRLPLAVVAAFGAVLVLFAVTSGAQRPAEPADGDGARIEAPDPTPERSPCVTCGIGRTCDEETGECVLIERPPPSCVQGSTFDEEAGYCIPDPTPKPRPTEAPIQTFAPDATPRSTPPPGFFGPTQDPEFGQQPEEPDDGDNTQPTPESNEG